MPRAPLTFDGPDGFEHFGRLTPAGLRGRAEATTFLGGAVLLLCLCCPHPPLTTRGGFLPLPRPCVDASGFLGAGDTRSSFFNTTIKFFPKAPELKEQEAGLALNPKP